MSKKISSLAVVMALAVVLFGAVVVALQPQAAQADVTTPNLLVFATGAKTYTATYTTSAQYIGNRTLMQPFAALDVSNTQTITMKIQASPDGVSPWVDIVTISAGSVDTIPVPSQVNALGTYIRGVVQAGTSATFTPTLKVVLK